MQRRNFIYHILLSGIGASLLPQNLFSQSQPLIYQDFPKLQDLTQLIPNPVILDKIEILQFEKNCLFVLLPKMGIGA